MKDTYLYIGTFVLIFAVATTLLWFSKLQDTIWRDVIQWAFAALCAGGGVAAVRGIKITKKPTGSTDGTEKPTGNP